jgi:hypothetical protein
MADRYLTPCSGCFAQGGHPSFWKTVIESPQWDKWKKYAWKKMLYDFPEVEELGCISPKHFQEFIAFVIKKSQANN